MPGSISPHRRTIILSLFSILCCLAALPHLAQSADDSNLSWLADALSFEMEHSGDTPARWGGGPPETIHVDGDIVHGGRWAVRIERTGDSPNSFSTITQMIPVDFAGSELTLRGYLRIEDVTEYVGLWMREDGDAGVLQFDNMSSQTIRGTSDWTQYEIVLPFDSEAKSLVFGALIAGTGTMWVDDLELLVDGKPVWEAPPQERPKTVLDFDREFDNGSGIAMDEISTIQIENLVTLGKVWGFLKYHHPAVTEGRYHWDYELFRVLPQVLESGTREDASTAITVWIAGLDTVGLCSPCAEAPDPESVHLLPDLDWIADEATLGAKLSQSLSWIYRNRSTSSAQFYVSLHAGVSNPVFGHELNYQSFALPDAGLQLLGLYRFWNIIEYWFPYRDLLEEDWDDVLSEFVTRVALAPDRDSYQLAMMALTARVHDTHCNLWSSLALRPPVGDCQLPVTIRFVEDRAVVTGYSSEDAAEITGLRPGDVITQLDGVAVEQLVESWAPLYAASNRPTRLRDIGRALTRGNCGECEVQVIREGEVLDLTLERMPSQNLDISAGRTHDRPGDPFQLLSDDIAYLKLSGVERNKSADYIARAQETKGLIIDIRNYPSEFLVFSFGQYLVSDVTPFVRFTKGDSSNPGAFTFMPNLTLTPERPTYDGRIVILVDEATQSSAEYHSMAFRAAPGAVVVGSTTAGADGNASWFVLPGSLRSMISGIGVFYPDKTPTQRVGIVPDVVVRPTIAGIREGRDEVLAEAIRQILGDDDSAAHILEKTQ